MDDERWLFEISQDGKKWAILAEELTEEKAGEWVEGFLINNPTWHCRTRPKTK